MDKVTSDQIKEARQRAGLSQSAAAALVYRSTRNWQQWEGGEREMDKALFELFLIKTNMLAIAKK